MVKVLVVNYRFSDSKGGDHRVQNLAKGLEDLELKGVFISMYGISYNLDKIKIENRGALVRKYFDLLMRHKVLGVISGTFLNTLMLMRHMMRYQLREKELEVSIVSVPVLFKLIPFLLLKKPRILVIDFGDLWSRYTYAFHKLIGKSGTSIADPLAKLYTSMEEIINLKILSGLHKACDVTLITVPTRAMEIFLRRYGFSNVYFLHHPVDIYLDISMHIDMTFDESLNIIIFSSSDLKSDEELEVVTEIGDLVRKDGLKGKIFIISPNPGKERERLRKYINGNDLVVLPILRRGDYLRLLRKMHLAIVLEPENVARISLVPRHISKVAEFSCLGIPTITNSLALRDYVINGFNGLIAPLSKIPGIVQGIIENPELFHKLRVNSLKLCKDRLLCSRVALKLLKLVLQTIKERQVVRMQKNKKR